MPATVSAYMTPNPIVQPETATLLEAARIMRDEGIGDVLVERDGALCGIVTDRDIVIRGLPAGRAPSDVRLGEICSSELFVLEPDADVEEAIDLMRQRALRRVPVCEGDIPVGILSLGDLAIERDGSSALADISAAPPNL